MISRRGFLKALCAIPAAVAAGGAVLAGEPAKPKAKPVAYPSPDFEKDVTDIMAKEITDEIDHDIMHSLMKQYGRRTINRDYYARVNLDEHI